MWRLLSVARKSLIESSHLQWISSMTKFRKVCLFLHWCNPDCASWCVSCFYQCEKAVFWTSIFSGYSWYTIRKLYLVTAWKARLTGWQWYNAAKGSNSFLHVCALGACFQMIHMKPSNPFIEKWRQCLSLNMHSQQAEGRWCKACHWIMHLDYLPWLRE